MPLHLDAVDEALLAGQHGAAAAHAMRLLQIYGEAVGAEKFIPIRSAHIDGCLYHGQSSIDFARRFVDLGGQVRVPTTLNVAAVDVLHPGWNQGPAEIIDAQTELTDLHERLGCLPTLTCAPYQLLTRPSRGEDIAWAESNAIVFANSVLGARTDRYGDFTDLCAALTGRVPYAGLHLDENRAGTLLVHVVEFEQTGMARDMYFASVGYALGARAAGRIPIVTGLPRDSIEDELKSLGSASATSGAIALFHAVGITPEAPSIEAARFWAGGPLDETAISAEDLGAAAKGLCPVSAGEKVAAMCLGTPHFSMEEFRSLSPRLTGRRAADGVEVYISTSRAIAAEVDADPSLRAIAGFGARLVVDTCTYLAPVVRDGSGVIVTNSAKWAHYGPGNLKRRVGLMSIEHCIRSAETGQVVPA